MKTSFDNLSDEEKKNLVRICGDEKIRDNWIYSFNDIALIDGELFIYIGYDTFVNSAEEFVDCVPECIPIPNGDQWKWVPGWDMDCGSVVDEVKQPDGTWKKLNVILNAMKPCEAVVSEHENAIYAHALAWDKFTKED